MLKFRVVYTPRALTESVHWVYGHGMPLRSEMVMATSRVYYGVVYT
jgi:hypothetical protein